MANQSLSDIDLDEVSLVDEPANQFAKVVLSKKADKYVCKMMDCPMGGALGSGEVCKHKDCPGKVNMSKCGTSPCQACAEKACDTHMNYSEEVEKAPSGIQFNVGFKDGGGSEVQSVVFDSSKWDAAKAKKWLEDHTMHADKVDETENTLRFRQHDPADYSKFRMISPGKQVSKALRAKQSFSEVQNVITSAVRAKFELPKPKAGAYPSTPSNLLYIRDLYKDSAVFDLDGQVYRTDYSVSRNDSTGEMEVNLSDKVPVEIVYQDIVTKKEPDPVPGSLLSRLAKLEVSLSRHHT